MFNHPQPNVPNVSEMKHATILLFDMVKRYRDMVQIQEMKHDHVFFIAGMFNKTR